MLGHTAEPPPEPVIQRWYTAKKPLPKMDGRESTKKGGTELKKSRKQSLNPLTMFGLGFFHRQIFFEDDEPDPFMDRDMYGGPDVGTGLWGQGQGPQSDGNREATDYTKDGVRGDDDRRMRRAVFQINKDGAWDTYNILTRNCQHYVKAALKKRQELQAKDEHSND
jgi:hypothetical protein